MISFLVSVVKDFAELVSDKYKAMMMKLSLQITGSREDAEEAVQDALLSVHRNQRKITDINSADARNYIYTVTKNAALKIRRQQAKHDSDVTFSDVEGFINIEGQPDIDAFKDEYGFSEEVAMSMASPKRSRVPLNFLVMRTGISYVITMVQDTITKKYLN